MAIDPTLRDALSAVTPASLAHAGAPLPGRPIVAMPALAW